MPASAHSHCLFHSFRDSILLAIRRARAPRHPRFGTRWRAARVEHTYTRALAQSALAVLAHNFTSDAVALRHHGDRQAPCEPQQEPWHRLPTSAKVYVYTFNDYWTYVSAQPQFTKELYRL